MNELEFTFIGTGNAFAPNGMCWNGFVVNERYLFETPPSALMALNEVGADPNELDAIVLSHHHGDHFLGLPFLMLHWKYRGRTRPIRIIGPVDTQRLALEIAENVFPGVLDLPFEIEWEVATPGQRTTVGPLLLEPLEMNGSRIEARPHRPQARVGIGNGALPGRQEAGRPLCEGRRTRI